MAEDGLAMFGLAGAVGIAYFLAACLGLALLSSPSGVPVFWPASGVAVGFLIIFGRRFGPAVVIGVIVGTVAANVISDRSFLTSLLKGICNAGEVVLAAWLLDQLFGRPFAFGDLRRVAGFLVAAALATAASATVGAWTMTQLHTHAPYWNVWRAWFLSDWVGIVVMAPLMIGLAQMWRELPSRNEWIEGLGLLGITAMTCLYTMSFHAGSWLSFSPSAFVLPLLLWLAARCRPTFGIAGAFLASMSIIYATTFGIGRFGDAAVPLIERVRGAQVATMTVTIFTLVLTALFAQRKEAEKGLRESEQLLAKKSSALTNLHEVGSRLWLKRDLNHALDEILAGAITLLGADMGTIRILDSTRGVLKIEAHRGFKQFFLDSFNEVSAVGASPCGRALRSGERMVIADVETDVHFAPFRPLARAAGFRAVQSTPVASREGVLLGTLATHFRSVHEPVEQDLRLLDLYVRQAADIIERHQAENTLRESEERLRLVQLRTGVGIWDWNLQTGKLTWTPQLEAVFGLEPGSAKSYADFRDRIHPNDIQRIETNWHVALDRRDIFNDEFCIIRPDGQVRWILATGGAFYDEATGEPTRILGNSVDITERKHAELALTERNLQLALAGQACLVGSFAYDTDTEIMQISEGYAALHGLRSGTSRIARSEWLAGVHTGDVERVQVLRSEVFRQRRRECNAEFRIVRPGGEVRWIEKRSFITYGDDGRPKRVIGISIDITNRKQMENLLRESETRYRALYEDNPSMYFTVDAKGTVLSVNQFGAESLGYTAAELVGQSLLKVIHDEDHEAAQQRLTLCRRNSSRLAKGEIRKVRRNGTILWVRETARAVRDPDGRTVILIVCEDITERKELEDHKSTLIAELDHRVKNVLATVSSVASRTQETSSSMAEFVAALDGRIKSMAATHELLSDRRWQGVPLVEILRRELAPYATASNTHIDGPDVELSAEAGQILAMVFHELATNAAKFGAISVKSGRVSVRWSFRRNGRAESCLYVDWAESGGPDLLPPVRSGFGTSVVRELVPYELGGTANLMHLREGIRCELQIPTRWLNA
jgi:PAS domain S-box-containing protein